MFIIDRLELPSSALTEFPGLESDAGTSLIFVDLVDEGAGPALHRHPYSETFIILSGHADFIIGDDKLVGIAGQVIIVPPLVPHCFAKSGTGHLQMIDVHANDRFITEWL
jgi:mannose-6-phosphate isomerase-like protein (cupin superfamily)